MENKYYWRYYRLRQKAEKMEEEIEKLRKELERYKKYYEVTVTLLAAMTHFCRNDTVDAERITHYKNALKDFKMIANPNTYNWMAPIFERAIAELEKRLQAKR
jgi:CHASE3 domain sensor protein